MNNNLTSEEQYAYLRMALVAGIVAKGEVIAWADHELLHNPEAGYELIELSLAGSQPYSQIIWLLNSFGGSGGNQTPLKLLFARAGLALAREPDRAREIIMGLRLINEEEYLPHEIRRALKALEANLERYERGEVTYQELHTGLKAFLEPYRKYRSWLEQV
jgi:hypothetical protein